MPCRVPTEAFIFLTYSVRRKGTRSKLNMTYSVRHTGSEGDKMVSLFLLQGCNLSGIVDLLAALHELASAHARTLLKLASSVRAQA